MARDIGSSHVIRETDPDEIMAREDNLQHKAEEFASLSGANIHDVLRLTEKLGGTRVSSKRKKRVLIPFELDLDDLDASVAIALADFKLAMKMGGKRKDLEAIGKIVTREEAAIAEYVKVGIKLGELHWMCQRIAFNLSKVDPGLNYREEAIRVKLSADESFQRLRFLLLQKRTEAEIIGVKESSITSEEEFYKIAVTDLWRKSFVHFGVDIPKSLLLEKLDYVEHSNN